MGALTEPRVMSLSQVLRSAIADATKCLQSLGGLKGEKYVGVALAVYRVRRIRGMAPAQTHRRAGAEAQ